MPNIFVVSDTWFNRLLVDDPNENVLDNNDHIIQCWNEEVNKGDIVYVLGGFGIGDLYHILVRLNGEIHFLDNYFNSNEREYIEQMKACVDKSSDPKLRDNIIFELNQIKILKDYDVILSYFPLGDWIGKSTGTYCFHGMTEEMSIINHNISCVSNKWENRPVNILEIQHNIEKFSNILGIS